MSRDADIFEAACALSPAERAAFLQEACGGDSALRARVESLLAGYAEMERAVPAAVAARRLATPAESAGDVIGRYTLREKLGEGGCGVVWRAEQQVPVRREVALKVIKLGMDTQAVIARFEAERQALALMDHPSIAKILDAGATDTGRPYFVMELVRGVPITRYCDEHRLTPEQRLRLFIEICGALHHAHEQGIVHRDIKPSNILVRPGETPRPVVIDFGIAKAAQGRLTDATLFTAVEQFIGTPAYMSPEQVAAGGAEIDARSDVYSLGVLLYELLTGLPPFDPKSLQQAGLDEVRRIIREVDPPRPSTRLRTRATAEHRPANAGPGSGDAVPMASAEGDLDWIVMRCLEKDRQRRYDSARSLAQDLERHLRHEPVTARAPSAAYVAGKFIRRHRLVVSAGALLAAGMLMTWVVARQAVTPTSGIAQPVPAPAPVSPMSIALLPFKNDSPDPAHASYADGLHEDLLNHLLNIRELIVRSRTSVEPYRETRKGMPAIGAELGVAFVLEGSVRREDGRVHLSVRLIDARSDSPRWARAYHRELRDIFAVQTEIATAIAGELRAPLSPEEQRLLAQKPTDSSTAYDLYLEGRRVFRRADGRALADDRYEKAENLFKAAVDEDPSFASAWAGLAAVHDQVYLGNIDHSPARLEKARKATGMAVRLAPETVTAFWAQADFSYATRDWTTALTSYERLSRQQPHNPARCLWEITIGACYRRLGRWPEAIAATRRAQTFDTEHEWRPDNLLQMLETGRRFDEANAVEREWLSRHPEEWERHFALARRAFLAGRPVAEAEGFLRALTAEQIASETGIFRRKQWAFLTGNLEEFVRLEQAAPAASPPRDQTQAAMVYFARGNPAVARSRLPTPVDLLAKLRQQPENDNLLLNLATTAALLGDREEALRRSEESAQRRSEAADAWGGTGRSSTRAIIHAWAGDTERAVAELTRLIRIPGSTLNVHEMKHSPAFLPLRGNPRFEALVNDPKNNEPLF